MLIQFHTTLRNGDDKVISDPIYIPVNVTKESIPFLEKRLPKIIAYYNQFYGKKIFAATIVEKSEENFEKKITFRTRDPHYNSILNDFLKQTPESVCEEADFALFMIEDLKGWMFENAFVDEKDRLIVTFENSGMYFQYQVQRKREYRTIESKNYKHYDIRDSQDKRYRVDAQNSDFFPGNSWDISQVIKGEVVEIVLTERVFRIRTEKGWIEWGSRRDGFVKLTDITEDEVIVSGYELKKESYRVEGISRKKASDKIFHGVHRSGGCGISLSQYTSQDYIRDNKDFGCYFSVIDNRTDRELYTIFTTDSLSYDEILKVERDKIGKIKQIIEKVNENGDFSRLKTFVYPSYGEFVKKMSEYIGG